MLYVRKFHNTRQHGMSCCTRIKVLVQFDLTMATWSLIGQIFIKYLTVEDWLVKQ